MRFLCLLGLTFCTLAVPACAETASLQSIKTLVTRYQRLDRQVNDITFCALRHRADRPDTGLVYAAKESLAFGSLGEQIHGLQRDIEWAISSTSWTTRQVRSGEALVEQRWLRRLAATVNMMNVARIYAEGYLAAPTPASAAQIATYRKVWKREEKRLGLGHRL